MKPHVAGILSALLTFVGVLSAPQVLSVLPGKYAAILTVAGLIAQAFTKPVTAGGTDLVPKAPTE